MSSLIERQRVFDSVATRAQSCRLCATMDGRRRVLSRLNGPVEASAIFVAEAPGRLGADRSGVPLSGDQAARNFEFLMDFAGLKREQVFVTNAVLCNPRDPLDRNRRPAQIELTRCRSHLTATLDCVVAPIVVALGSAGLAALHEIAPHGLKLSRDVGRVIAWRGRQLVGLYHPGARARIHRPLALQLTDFAALGTTIRAGGW